MRSWRSLGIGLTTALLMTGLVIADETARTVADVPDAKLPPRPTKSMLAYPDFDPGLSKALTAAEPLAEAEARGFKVKDGRIHVNIVARQEQLAELIVDLDTAGATNVLSAWNQVEAFVTPAVLDRLSTHPAVTYVRRPSYAVTPPMEVVPGGMKSGYVISEGVAAMNADVWHDAGFTGQGVRVGVIDGSFGGYDILAGADLPSLDVVEARDFTGFGIGESFFGEHGTACAEIVYDFAPDVERMLLAQADTPVQIANAVDWMRLEGIRVISMSLGWFTWGSGDGQGPLAEVINSFSDSGGIWVNAAGNSALAHWAGRWNDPDGDGWLNFEGNREINFITRDGEFLLSFPSYYPIFVPAVLTYNQWSNTVTDLDLCLVHWNGIDSGFDVIECADSDNIVSGLPIEELSTFALTGGFVGFAVWKAGGPGQIDLEIFHRVGDLPLSINSKLSSLSPPGDAEGAIQVAAVDVESLDLEPYSSWGPTNGPGGSLSGGVIKPDIASFANVSTRSYGPGVFNGTSSAAPHVAGAAALMWSAYPDYPRWRLRNLLESSCQDVGTMGQDFKYGHGRLMLPSPPTDCLPPGIPANLHTGTPIVFSGSEYKISWTFVPSADGYELEEDTAPGFNDPNVYRPDGTSKAFMHETDGATFYYRIRSTTACGAVSRWSEPISVFVYDGARTVTRRKSGG